MDENKSVAFELIREQGCANKRQAVLIGLLIFCLAFSNMAWLYVWNQYDYETEITVQADDTSSAIYQDGKGNVINNGSKNFEGAQKNQK